MARRLKPKPSMTNRNNRLSALVGGAVLLGACGASTAPDIATYQQLLTQAGSVVATHLDAGTQVTTVADCTLEHSRYDGQMRPLVTQMQSMSGEMDACWMGSGHMMGGGFGAGCNSMLSELDAHAAAACPSMDVAQDWAETRRDCEAMTVLLHGEQDDITSVSGMSCHH